ncbi:MAG: DUF6266 family protein, partial [Bacteroidota bacterium]|nr:DUF6266 family protein [Bacteroidota bacterium]
RRINEKKKIKNHYFAMQILLLNTCTLSSRMVVHFHQNNHYNLNNALSGVYPEYFIDYASTLVSRGTLPGALNPQIQSSNPGQVDFTWQDNSQDANASANDKVLLVVFNPAKQQAITIIGGNDRSVGAQAIDVPSTFAGDEVQCFIAFQNLNQSVLSNSVYAGPVVVYD